MSYIALLQWINHFLKHLEDHFKSKLVSVQQNNLYTEIGDKNSIVPGFMRKEAVRVDIYVNDSPRKKMYEKSSLFLTLMYTKI